MDSEKTQALTDQEVDDILHKNIIDLLGMQGLSEEKKKEFQDNVLKAIENRTYARVLKLLEEKGRVEEYKKAEDIDKFLADVGIDVDKIYVEEALYYKLQMKGYGKVIDDGLLGGKVKNGD